MDKPVPPVAPEQIARVFRALAEEHAADREPAERKAAWNRVELRALAAASNRRRSSAVRWLVPALAAVIVLALGVWSRQPSLDFHVSGAVVKDGEIRTTTQRGVVAFTDGSRVEASERTALSVSIVGEHAALTRLSRGNLRVHVRHEDDTDWLFLAGPYEVKVVGTRFDLGWDPEASRLSVAMLEGRVRVRGPGKVDRLLSKGERFDWPPVVPAPKSVPAAPIAALEPAPESTPDSAKGPGVPLGARAGRPSSARTSATAPRDAKSGDWTELVSLGRFEDVVAAAERAGIDAVLAARGPVELKALAHAARYSGRTALALRTWHVIRERFAGQSAALHAAFFIGRIHDQQGRTADAKRWLGAYIAESPGGTYASEALGRQLLLIERTEGRDVAKRAARQYLERFPSGAYAKAARAITQSL